MDASRKIRPALITSIVMEYMVFFEESKVNDSSRILRPKIYQCKVLQMVLLCEVKIKRISPVLLGIVEV